MPSTVPQPAVPKLRNMISTLFLFIFKIYGDYLAKLVITFNRKVHVLFHILDFFLLI